MIKLKLTLLHKGILLVSIPLMVELVFLAVLAILHTQAEEEALKALRSGAINNLTNQLVRDLFEIASLSRAEFSHTIASPKYNYLTTKIRSDIEALKDIVQDNATQTAIVARSAAAAERANRVLNELRQICSQDGSLTSFDAANAIRNELKACMKNMVSSDLISMAQAERMIEKKSPAIQSKLRKRIKCALLAVAIFNIAVAAVLTTMLSRNIIGRLNIIVDNSFRLASNLPLRDPIGGGDEIANLDLSFHSMASALQEAKRRERALVDNAQDVICSLDSTFRFVAVSQACEKILGYKEIELIGMSLRELIVSEEREKSWQTLKQIRQDGSDLPFETMVRRQDGRVIALLWSVHWVQSEKSMFCVAHDITERKEAERIKQEVMAMVSHDLRTPLATIAAFHEMLASGALGALSDRAKRLLSTANHNTSRMLTLINDLIEMERIKSGRLPMESEDISLGSIFAQSQEAMANWAAQMGIKLEFLPNPFYVRGNLDRLLQVLANLVANAVKFSDAGGKVVVSALAEQDFVVISVADCGRGVPDQFKEKIFERFQQVQASDAQEKNGSGLGLAICKAIVEMHGGTIYVKDNHGAGSIFSFTLPRAEKTSLIDEQPFAKTN